MGVMRCPVCGERLMYRTRITIEPYGFASSWVCPVCEQEKNRPCGRLSKREQMGCVPKKEELNYD